jgi:hypothetical protein
VPNRGVLYIHSAPRALCPHVEWAVAGVLGARVSLDWARQPAAAALWRCELPWQSPVAGTATRLASALRGWEQLRFEVTEEPSAGAEGERYSSTPQLGVFHAVTGIHGDIMIPEDRLRAAMMRAARTGDLEEELHKLLGKPWDDELESFRCAGEGAPVRWLHQVV